VRVCRRCGDEKQEDQFKPLPSGNRSKVCRRCHRQNCDKQKIRDAGKRWRDKNPGYELKKRYGISAEEYQKLFALQKGCCAICGKKPSGVRKKRLSVDHNHVTDIVRGLLCGLCNAWLGRICDKIEIVLFVVTYLRRGETTIPIYEHMCPNNHKFERLHKSADDLPEPCPHCGASAEKVEISVPAKFQWGSKGRGF